MASAAFSGDEWLGLNHGAALATPRRSRSSTKKNMLKPASAQTNRSRLLGVRLVLDASARLTVAGPSMDSLAISFTCKPDSARAAANRGPMVASPANALEDSSPIAHSSVGAEDAGDCWGIYRPSLVHRYRMVLSEGDGLARAPLLRHGTIVNGLEELVTR